LETDDADWSHEKEIRLIKGRCDPIPVIQDVLKSVIYTRTNFPEWGSVMMLLHRLYPDVQLVQMKFAHKEPFVTSQRITTKKVPIDQI
jgi:hypothetical protein